MQNREKVVINGNINAHIGRVWRGYKDVMGVNGMGQRNQDGKEMLQMFQQYGLKVCNTMFKKKEDYLIFYKSGDTVQPEIHYIQYSIHGALHTFS